MKISHYLFITLILTGFAHSIFAQVQTKVLTRGEIEVLEQISDDAKNLELPENRASVYSQIGVYFWETDKNRAEQLFQDAVNELIEIQNEAALEENIKPPVLIYGYVPRHQIIFNISRFDPQSAYAYFLKSRPQKLAQKLVEFENNPNFYNDNLGANVPILQEVTEELRLKVSVAGQNPERAPEFIKDDLKNGITSETLDFLKELYKINPKLADQLTEKAVLKILSIKSFSTEDKKLTQYKFRSYLMTAQRFLTVLGREAFYDRYPMTVSNKTLRKLADKLSLYWLERETNINIFGIKTVEKFFPERALKIKEKQKAPSTQDPERQKLKELLESDLSAQELVNQAESVPKWKNFIYDKAVCTLVKSGDVTGAINLLNEKIPDKNYVKMHTFRIYNDFAMRELLKDNFDNAEILINKISEDGWKIRPLIYLAIAVYLKNPAENKEESLRILDQASSISNKYSGENLSELVVSAYTLTDKDQGIKLFESFINGLISQKNSYSATGLRSFPELSEAIYILKTDRFQQIVNLINKADRAEIRIPLKLILFNDRRLNLKTELSKFRTCRF